MKAGPDPTNTATFLIQELPLTKAGQLRLVLSGSLDVDGAPIRLEKLREILNRGTLDVDLDFTKIGFVSSLGIGTLIAAIGEYREAKGNIVVGGLSEEILAVLGMLDLLDFVTLRG